MALAKIMGKINQTIKNVQGALKITPTGDLTLKRMLLPAAVNSAQSASILCVSSPTGSASGSFPSGSGGMGQFAVAGVYFQDGGFECMPAGQEDTNNASWAKSPTYSSMPAVKMSPHVYPCAQYGSGLIRTFEIDFAKYGTNDGSINRLRWWFDGFPQYCTPRAVSVQVLETISGSGVDEGVGDVYVEQIGILMQEQGYGAVMAVIYEDPDGPGGHGWDFWAKNMNFVTKPLGTCVGSKVRAYVDKGYFYNSASIANCCFPPLSGAGEYAVYGAMQGGQGVFSEPRYGNGVLGNPTITGSNSTYTQLYACYDGETINPNITASFIHMTQWPINKVYVALNKRMHGVATGKLRICCYFDRVYGGFDTSENFRISTPQIEENSTTNTRGGGIFANCVSGTIVP